MADKPEQAAAARIIQVDQVPWTRSGEYRLVGASIFKTRICVGDCTMTFSSISETPGLIPTPIVQEEVAVTLSWNQIKALSLQLNDVVLAIEAEIGDLPIPPFTHPPAKYRELLPWQGRELFGRKQRGKAHKT